MQIQVVSSASPTCKFLNDDEASSAVECMQTSTNCTRSQKKKKKKKKRATQTSTVTSFRL